MRHGIRRFPALWRATRLARRWYHARHGAYPDWTELLSAPGEAELWRAAKASAHGGPRVLIATAIGSYAHAVTLESALAMALTFRHAEVHAQLALVHCPRGEVAMTVVSPESHASGLARGGHYIQRAVSIHIGQREGMRLR